MEPVLSNAFLLCGFSWMYLCCTSSIDPIGNIPQRCPKVPEGPGAVSLGGTFFVLGTWSPTSSPSPDPSSFLACSLSRRQKLPYAHLPGGWRQEVMWNCYLHGGHSRVFAGTRVYIARGLKGAGVWRWEEGAGQGYSGSKERLAGLVGRDCNCQWFYLSCSWNLQVVSSWPWPARAGSLQDPWLRGEAVIRESVSTPPHPSLTRRPLEITLHSVSLDFLVYALCSVLSPSAE